MNSIQEMRMTKSVIEAPKVEEAAVVPDRTAIDEELKRQSVIETLKEMIVESDTQLAKRAIEREDPWVGTIVQSGGRDNAAGIGQHFMGIWVDAEDYLYMKKFAYASDMTISYVVRSLMRALRNKGTLVGIDFTISGDELKRIVQRCKLMNDGSRSGTRRRVRKSQRKNAKGLPRLETVDMDDKDALNEVKL